MKMSPYNSHTNIRPPDRRGIFCSFTAFLVFLISSLFFNLNAQQTSFPDNVMGNGCSATADSIVFNMTELFSCTGVNSMSTPMVADLDGDGQPEIIACGVASGGYWLGQNILIFNGQTGALIRTIITPDYYLQGQCFTIADANRDGQAEIFMLERAGFVHCYNNNGTQRWVNMTVIPYNYLLTVADIMGDSSAQLVCGPYIFNADDGTLLIQGNIQTFGMGFGAPHGHTVYFLPYYMYALADINLDGSLELCAGNSIYDISITNHSGTIGNSWTLLRQAESNTEIINPDGQTFIADFDGDGDIDVCVIGTSHDIGDVESTTASVQTVNTYVWDGQSAQIVAHASISNTSAIYKNYSPSIPCAADIDSNGTPEIIFNWHQMGMIRYTYDPSQVGNMRELPRHLPFGGTNGFTVFDFNKDSRNEIVYRGTSDFFVVDGFSLDTLCEPATAYSGTLTEYPVVADVNGDGHAEILIARSPSPWNNTNPQGSITVYGSATPEAWSSARKVWNQWAYSSVNINEDLSVPQFRFNVATPFSNGTQPFNCFLKQMPYIDTTGELFNPIADLVVLQASSLLADDTLSLSVQHSNMGGIAATAPYGITIYKNNYRGALLYTDTISIDLLPDSTTTSILRIPVATLCNLIESDSIVIAVNDLGDGIAQHGRQQQECDTTNNTIKTATPVYHNSSDTVATVCDSLTWHSATYTTSGTPTYSTTNTIGCDSTITLHLTVNYSSHRDTAATVCERFSWHDSNYYVSGTHLYNTTNAVGCDSTVTLTLVVNDTNITNESAEICISQLPYSWNGTDITTTLTGRTPFVSAHTFNATNVAGCDSTVTLTLTVYPSDSATDHQRHCDSYMWIDGVTYTESTEAPILYLGNQYGCDSLVTLNLIIDSSFHYEYVDSLCTGSSYTFADMTITTGGIFTNDLTASNGCDSTITLMLTLLEKPNVSIVTDHDCPTRTHMLHVNSNVDFVNWSVNSYWNESWGSPYSHNIAVSPSQPLTFTVLTDYNNYPTCPNTTSITISPITVPQAVINAKPEFLSNENRTLVAISQSTGADWLQWFINGDFYGGDVSITYTPDIGADSISLILVAANNLCFDTAAKTIPIYTHSIFAPNVFTPDETSNRTFNVFCNGIVEYELDIYSRQGVHLFHSNSPFQPWDGTFKGRNCPYAGYVWIVRYRTLADPQNWHTEMGSVLLLR